MRKLNKLRWVVAIAAAFFIGLTLVTTTQAATRDQGIDAAIYQGKNTYHAYPTDKFMISQIGGSQGGGIYTQNTYHSQVQSAMSHGVRAHTYLWYGIGDNLINARACMDYFLPRIETPKGSIVALDYEDGAKASYWNGAEYVSTLAEKESNTKAIIYGMQRIKDAGYTPMYYSYKPYTDKHVNYQEIVNKFGNKCIWIAGYPDYQVRNKPLYSFFPSMNGVGMWQFTSTYVAGGLDGNVDLTGVTNNGYNGKQPTPKPTPKPKPAKKVDVTYAFHRKGGNWYSNVKNFGSGSNGYAGAPYCANDLLYLKVNRGSIKYRVHTIEDGWLPWVHKANKSDTVNGVAGIKGHTIDGVQMYYTTPKGETYQQAYYRSQTTQRANYLGTCADNGSVSGYDSWAGMLGEPLDRLQISINDHGSF